MTMRSSLASVAASCREPDPAVAARLAREAYRDTDGEVVLITRSSLASWADRKMLELLAVKAGVAPGKRAAR